MQSSMVRAAATSERVRMSVPRVRGSCDEMVKTTSWLDLHGRAALAEYARGCPALENDFGIAHNQHRPLAQPDNRRVVLLVILKDPLLLCLSHVCRGRVGVEVVGAYLKRH